MRYWTRGVIIPCTADSTSTRINRPSRPPPIANRHLHALRVDMSESCCLEIAGNLLASIEIILARGGELRKPVLKKLLMGWRVKRITHHRFHQFYPPTGPRHANDLTDHLRPVVRRDGDNQEAHVHIVK